MWNYERRLQYPVNITSPNAKIAQIILSQYGGPDGEAAASFRYLSQRYSMPDRKVAGLLTDIGTEELAHLEMVASIVRQLTKGLSAEELEEAGFAPYYVDHTAGIWPQAAGGIPFNAVLVVVNVRRILEKPVALVDGHRNDAVVLSRRMVDASCVSLVFLAQEAFRIAALLC